MRLRRKMILSLGALWVAFLGIVYIGAYQYLPNSLLKMGGEQNKSDISLAHYAITHIINHYFLMLLIIGCIFAVLMGYLLRVILLSHLKNLEDQFDASVDYTYTKRIKLTTEDELFAVAKQFNSMLDVIQVLQSEVEQFVLIVDELNKELMFTSKRAAQADKTDGIFHKIADLLNSIGTDIYLMREQIKNSNAERLADLEENNYLTEELMRLDKNVLQIKYIMKQFDMPVTL